MEPYYERRSAEYDDWYLGAGLFAVRDRPGWDEALRELGCDLAAGGFYGGAEPANTID